MVDSPKTSLTHISSPRSETDLQVARDRFHLQLSADLLEMVNAMRCAFELLTLLPAIKESPVSAEFLETVSDLDARFTATMDAFAEQTAMLRKSWGEKP